MNIPFNPTTFNPIRFNPTQGFAQAADIFQGINGTLADHKAEESLAATRAETLALANRKQQFAEDAPKRKLLEQQEILNKSNLRAGLGQEILSNSGGSLKEQFLANPANQAVLQANPEFRKLTGLSDGVGPLTQTNQANVDDFIDQGVNANKRLFSQSDNFRDEVLTKALSAKDDQGNPVFSAEQAEALVSSGSNQLFKPGDKDVILKLLDTSKGSNSVTINNGGNKGASGTEKLLSRTLNASQETQANKDFFSANGIKKQRATFQLPQFAGDGRVADPFAVDITKEDVTNFLADMSKGPNGVRGPEARALLQTMITDGTTAKRIDKFSPDEILRLQLEAAQFKPAQNETFNSKGSRGNSVGQARQVRNERNQFNQSLLSGLNLDRTSQSQRLAAILSGLPNTAQNTPRLPPAGTRTAPQSSKSKKSSAVVGKILADLPDTDNQKTAAKRRKILNSTDGELDRSTLGLLSELNKRGGRKVVNAGRSLLDLLNTPVPFGQ